MDATDVALLAKSFEHALAAETGDGSLALLIDLGWGELFALEPRAATTELLEAQGRLLATSSALDLVVAEALGRALPGGAAVIHPRLGAPDAPPGCIDGTGTIWFSGLVVAGTARADRLVLPFTDAGGRLAVTECELVDVDAQPVAGFDPNLQICAVTGHADVPAVAGATGTDWPAVVAVARRALAHELCAVAQSVLERTTAYVSQRHQFGRPIGAFQSVRHQLTDVFVALASARAALDASWATGDPLLADAAKALAGKAGTLAARSCLQVTGAVGFTEEYELARSIRRTYLLDGLYGAAAQLQSRIGRRLIAARSVPRLHPLGLAAEPKEALGGRP